MGLSRLALLRTFEPGTRCYERGLRALTPASAATSSRQIATERDVSVATIAMAWVLRNPVVDSPIVGATKTRHRTAAALDIALTDDETAALESAYMPRTPTYFS